MTIQKELLKLDLLDYFSQHQSLPLDVKDGTYDKIVGDLNEFIKSLPENNKQLYYFKL